MSNDGSRIAIGAPNNDNFKGHVRVYQLDDSADPESKPESEPEQEPESEPEQEPEMEPEAEPEAEPESEFSWSQVGGDIDGEVF